MKLLRQATITLFLLVAAVFGVTQMKDRYFTDHTPPTITFNSDTITISAKASSTALLQGVTATDLTDGDLTSQVRIQGTTQLLTNNSAKVTYVVFDSSNNIATASRTVLYSDYEKPRFKQNAPLVFPYNQSINIINLLSATDLIDGDISKNIRISTSTMDIYTPGTYTVTAHATNSLGDTEIIPLKVVITNQPQVLPTFQLSEYIVYLNQGDAYDPQRYITSISNGNTVQVDASGVQTNSPGVYHAAFSHSSDHSAVYTVYQTVVVR